jgi:hypothetical protein
MSLRREREDPGTLHDTGQGELRQKGDDGVERVVKLKIPGLKPLGDGDKAQTLDKERPPQQPDEPGRGAA